MNDLVFVLMGVILAACAGLAAMCREFARSAKASRAGTAEDAQAALVSLREAAAAIAESHNDIVKTQSEQAQTIERLGSEVAGRTLRR